MTELAINARGLEKTFGGGRGPFKTPIVKALRGVDFKIERGENYCLLGPNGSGKTTLIRCILGLLESKGQVEVLGYKMPKERDLMIPHLGYMPQDLSLYPDLSVRETLSFFGRMFGIRGRTNQKKAIEHILEVLKLKRWESMTVEALSGGMKRRLSLACALVHKPQLIILDEPTVGVDPTLRISFWDYFKELNEAGATIITTTHVMDEAEKSRKIGFMRDGNLIAEGTVNELREKMEEEQKLIIGTNLENMDPIAEKIRRDFSLKVSSFKYKLEIHYNDDTIIEPILDLIQKHAKIRELQTVEPDLEDIFIDLSNKKEVDS